ncbi:MAG: hypothetical protein KDA79_08740 [Planctomycetaceae bacterium]|nr:hypothetical protein [Planctomycetaceae bacterium]
MSRSSIEQSRQQLQHEARQLAGGLGDLCQRATVYHQLYHASGGNHIFPLIAAHGALWAGGYFRFGRAMAQLLSLQYALQPRLRQQRLARLTEFENALKDINRRVCIDTWVNFHLTREYGTGSDVRQFMEDSLADALALVHAAQDSGTPLTDLQKREVFEAHFLHEQQHVVSDAVAEALENLQWPLVRAFALRPPVRFSYLPTGRRLWFRNFANREERIANGLKAFDLAAAAGWKQVEAALDDYHVLPEAVLSQPTEHFAGLRRQVLAA